MLLPAILALSFMGQSTLPARIQNRLAGTLAESGLVSTYVDARRTFALSTPQGWRFRDDYSREGAFWLADPMVAAWTGVGQPSLWVFRYTASDVKNYLRSWTVNGLDRPTGTTRGVPYKVSSRRGFTQVDGYIHSPPCVWVIEVHFPEAKLKERLPLALDIIGSFKLLKK